jgi:hypothetical protein
MLRNRMAIEKSGRFGGRAGGFGVATVPDAASKSRSETLCDYRLLL